MAIPEGKAEVVIKARGIGRHAEHGVSYANFKAHEKSHLDGQKVRLITSVKPRKGLLFFFQKAIQWGSFRDYFWKLKKCASFQDECFKY